MTWREGTNPSTEEGGKPEKEGCGGYSSLGARVRGTTDTGPLSHGP